METQKLEYSGQTSCYEHKRGDWEATPFAGKEAVGTVKLIEAQWSNMPVEVENDIAAAWQYLEFGNDDYYWKTTLAAVRRMGESGDVVDRDFNGREWLEPPNHLAYLTQWLEEQGFSENETLLIHWWW